MKASEAKLSSLHGKVAEVLTEIIDQKVDEVIYNKDGEAELTGNQVYSASPAMMAVAVKFLKDNNITCSIENNAGMQTLRDALAKKTKRSLGNASQAALRVVE